MKKRARESKLNVALTVVLVTFVCALAFSVGVVSGKGWSDREYALKTIEGSTSAAKTAMNSTPEEEPLSADLTDKEVAVLTAKALDEARKNPLPETNEAQDLIAEMEELDRLEMLAKGEKPDSKTENTAKKSRKVASVAKTPTMPKPKDIEYTVQVASYKSKEEAEAHSKKLIDKGFPAFPVKAMVKGSPWYRVSIGSFVSRNQAVKYQRDLKKQAVIKSSIVTKVLR